MTIIASSEGHGTARYHKVKSRDALGFAIICALGVAIGTWLFPSPQDGLDFSIFLVGVPMGMSGFFSHRKERKKIEEETSLD